MKQFESFALDLQNQCLWREGAQVTLQPKPFAVLRYLVEHSGRLITHDELLDKLWPETYVQPQVLRTYMLELRKVLGDDPASPRFIQTLPKRGYQFVAEVTEREDAPARSGSVRKAAAAAEEKPRAVAAIAASDEEAPSIVDREAELGALRGEFAALLTGQRRVVFVTGEAGIGKTALLDVFSYECRVSVAGVSVARGQCVEGFGGREEYYPVMEALSQLCASEDGGRACEVLARMAPAWLAAMGRHGASSAVAAHGDKMAGDLCAALEELAAQRPLVLVIEDLHWADLATMQLISALARRRAAARLMIVATCRPRDMHAEQPVKALRQDLRLRRLCAEICMTPLPKQAVCALLSRELKQEVLPEGLGTFVHQRSEGNPLFVIAILEHLMAQGFLKQAAVDGAQVWELRGSFQEMEASVPDGLAQMIEIEIERLSQEEQRLLEAGSLFSVAFPSWAVAAALAEDAAEIEEALDGLTRKLYFVQKAGQDELPDGSRSDFYAFAHDLYREVLYRRQSESRRARRHTRVAERLGLLFAEREDVVAREMAMHFEAAGEWRRAIQALRAAAQHAQARQQGAEATELLERALEISGNLGGSEGATLAEAMRGELASV